MVRFQLGRDTQGMAMRTHRLLWCIRIGFGFGLQAFLRDLLIPRALFSHFRSELCSLKPEKLECTHKGIMWNDSLLEDIEKQSRFDRLWTRMAEVE
ncbi:hypothetical protein PIB30_095538 [Stylosanthes scabra]|uniref:Uncharacterized protein n=1 Tax=Stylosanthes scabra TaxID=79078 RepID=A0ABU6RWR2_9FABA|nr:hypothetical protein [Stylosanthes scabra]